MERKESNASKLAGIALKAAAIGGTLALLCHFLPSNYRVACHAVASVCTGG